MAIKMSTEREWKMILFALMLASIIFGFIKSWKNKVFDDDKTIKILDGILYSFISCMVSGLIFFLALAITTSVTNVKYTTTSSYKIFALQDNQNTAGSFFLGSGTLDGVMKYTYMVETYDGYLMQSIEADTVTIKYSNDPKIETFTREFTNSTVKFLFIAPIGGSKQIISIPEGSIKNGYNVDLK